jgi:hypothetical protein
VGIASSFNWIICLIVSVAIPPVLTAIQTPDNDNIGWVFIFFGVLTGLGLIFIFFFMKETKDKSSLEIEYSFSGRPNYRRVVPEIEKSEKK